MTDVLFDPAATGYQTSPPAEPRSDAELRSATTYGEAWQAGWTIREGSLPAPKLRP
jgi:hypothetical protein